MRRLLLVRHGESEWNASRRLQGQADIGLSDTGREQARALAPVIAALAPDLSITSDLQRARETALLLAGAGVEMTPGLREIDVGDWTGEPIEALKTSVPQHYRGWRAGTFTPPNGEAWLDFVARTRETVEAAFARSERLLVVCHGGVVRALLESMVALPPSRIIPVGPASLTILADPGGRDAGSGDAEPMRLELFNYSPRGPILDAPD